MSENPFAKNQATSAEEALKIVPRAEFRVFGKDVADLVEKTCGMPRLSSSKLV